MSVYVCALMATHHFCQVCQLAATDMPWMFIWMFIWKGMLPTVVRLWTGQLCAQGYGSTAIGQQAKTKAKD